MNPYTGRFETLDTPAKLARAVSEGWAQFTEGEVLSIKGYNFTVTKIMPRGIVLRPVRKSR